jgi:hypothetical protein
MPIALKSGLQVGEPAGYFEVHDVTGLPSRDSSPDV